MSTTILPRPTKEEVIAAILKANPHLKLGEDIKFPIVKLLDGKYSDEGTVTEAFSLLINLPVTDESFKNTCFADKQYLHFFTIPEYFSPNPNLKVGDMVKAIDPVSYKTVDRELTQAEMNAWNRFIVRLAVS